MTRPDKLQAPKMGWLNFSSIMLASGISYRFHYEARLSISLALGGI
jgi:hypothetical protein